ncbi:hypothetical protein VTO73DRAFT_3296 [Trametes versicolor]
MASQPKNAEIIDLTEPDVIELNSDGELVPDARTPADPGSAPASTQPDQAKKKRRKRKRKSTGRGEMEEGEVGTSSAEVSRPHSRNSPNVDDLELIIEKVGADGDGAPPSRDDKKKTLKERLVEPEWATRREDAGERRREKRRNERKRDREREKEEDRARDRDRDRDRERRRSRSRDRERDRDRGGERSRKRSRSQDRDSRRRDKAPESSTPLFFEDVNPTEVPSIAKVRENIAGPSNLIPQTGPSNGTGAEEKDADGLLLPAHVSIAENGDDTNTSTLKVPTPEGSDDEDYIEYLDYGDDRRAGMVRYWELDKLAASEANASKPTKTVCKNCGAEGEHKTFECPVLICLTCGARDEHSTRSCPISKTCFTCGMKGHINRTCPNRAATRAGAYSHYQDCDRCGARTHQTNECPTLWRIYEYVADEERHEILRERDAKRTLALGEGGEGYIATDEWCYNCGGSGHLGDDCNDRPKMFDAPREPSAFSIYNILSGPFSSEASRPSQRAPRDWETADAFADGHGSVVPMEVGKQGRKKERARLERRAREIEEEDDEDDWFGGARARGRGGGGGGGGGHSGGGGGGGKSSRRDREANSSKANGGGGGNGKIRFDFSHSSTSRDGGGRDSKRQRVSYDDLPGPSRETDSIQIRGASKKQDRYGGSNHSRDRYDRDQSSRGPRYRGGYSR